MAEAQFLRCEERGAYDHVPAAEACTIAIAQRIGVFDSNAYFIPPFSSSTKTQSEDSVQAALDALKPAAMCSAAQDEERAAFVAFPLCGVIAGPASERVESPDGTASCQTSGCPPGFTQEGTSCVKPVLPSVTDKSQRCDSRWYDWFMVENAHLANGTQAGGDGGDTCYLPCPAGFVPNLAHNPVDGSATNLIGGGKDDIGHCAPKSSFYFRKYADTPDFCPLAWVYRLTTRPEDIVAGTQAAIEQLRQDSGGTDFGAVSESAARQAVSHAETDSSALYTSMMAITDRQVAAGRATSQKGGYLQACKTLNTPERLRYAFSVCDQLHANPASFKTKWSQYWGEQTDERMALLRQACHLVCCDQNNAASIGRTPVCFSAAELAPVTAAAAASSKATAAKSAAAALKQKRAQAATDQGFSSPAERTFFKSFGWLLLLIVVPLLFVIAWIVLIPVLRIIWSSWTGMNSCEGIADIAAKRACERGERTTAGQMQDETSQHVKGWTDRVGQVLTWLANFVGTPIGHMLGWSANQAATATGSVLGSIGHTFMDGFVSKMLSSLASILTLVLLFMVIMFVYFYYAVHDIRFDYTSLQGFAAFLNAFNWRDWEIFNWREFWLVRAINDFINPYRATASPDTIPRGQLAAGRCDNLQWVESKGAGAGKCASLVHPAPIVWTLDYPEGDQVPSTLRSAFPTQVVIPWESTDSGFRPSCDVAVTSEDGTITRQLMAPLDDATCALSRTDAPAFVDQYRPHADSDAFAGLDGYADASDPKC